MQMITEQDIDHIYDALSTMALASEILSRGNVDNKDASDMAWLLGSAKKRLNETLKTVEDAQFAQEKKQ
ncbi:hypothetical protein [Brucella gallinifaecis]|uniref:hypothetical protein n=1 Tax=Brucella gallinifaecis TaxID=215590 RepID=UPI002360A0BE|nr:hypothetical protein [Brucella gallinifaecis]